MLQETDGQMGEKKWSFSWIVLSQAQEENVLLPENVYFVHKLFIKITTSILI